MEINKKLFYQFWKYSAGVISGFLRVRLVRAENIVCNDIVKEKVLNIPTPLLVLRTYFIFVSLCRNPLKNSIKDVAERFAVQTVYGVGRSLM